jgi:hypothetical protein
MPLPLTIGCGLCSVIWTVYALLVMDFFIMVSEHAGCEHAGCEHAGCDAAARAPYLAHPSTCSLLERRPERLP